MVFLKQKKEKLSDHFLTSALLLVAKLTEDFIREQIIKSLNIIMVHFKISVLIIFFFDKVIILQEAVIRTMFLLLHLRAEGRKGALDYLTKSKLNFTQPSCPTLRKKGFKNRLPNTNFNLLSSHSLICNSMFFRTMVGTYCRLLPLHGFVFCAFKITGLCQERFCY